MITIAHPEHSSGELKSLHWTISIFFFFFLNKSLRGVLVATNFYLNSCLPCVILNVSNLMIWIKNKLNWDIT